MFSSFILPSDMSVFTSKVRGKVVNLPRQLIFALQRFYLPKCVVNHSMPTLGSSILDGILSATSGSDATKSNLQKTHSLLRRRVLKEAKTRGQGAWRLLLGLQMKKPHSTTRMTSWWGSCKIWHLWLKHYKKLTKLLLLYDKDEVATVKSKVMGPAISEKIASTLNNILACGLNEQATKNGKRTFIDLQIANCLHKLVSIQKFGTMPRSRHVAWIPGYKPYRTPW